MNQLFVYICAPLVNPPTPHPTPLGHPRALSWAPRQLPTGYPFCMWWGIYVSATLPVHPTLPLPLLLSCLLMDRGKCIHFGLGKMRNAPSFPRQQGCSRRVMEGAIPPADPASPAWKGLGPPSCLQEPLSTQGPWVSGGACFLGMVVLKMGWPVGPLTPQACPSCSQEQTPSVICVTCVILQLGILYFYK